MPLPSDCDLELADERLEEVARILARGVVCVLGRVSRDDFGAADFSTVTAALRLARSSDSSNHHVQMMDGVFVHAGLAFSIQLSPDEANTTSTADLEFIVRTATLLRMRRSIIAMTLAPAPATPCCEHPARPPCPMA